MAEGHTLGIKSQVKFSLNQLRSEVIGLWVAKPKEFWIVVRLRIIIKYNLTIREFFKINP
ncbi:hypothetical protein AO498_14965 [Algoriphagus sanaruensis]|uniref:Uncharacterized protein n=1 Tax=Algoriphagus sanaruensis TaxID=1727163 RepID=A0A142ERJ8_9BACT|nr:hypothetical protein AO498_14965 [Algoriphagus sanaruensis]